MISRELKRNRNKRGGYSPGLANETAMIRRERIIRNTALKAGVLARAMKLLTEKRWSPEQKSAILTIIERSTNIFMQAKLPSKKPEEVEKAVIRRLMPYKQYVHTITTDNGSEFMNHKNICKALECTVYFADPYCSGQKGAIENANRILREYFPKGTDFRPVTQEYLNRAQYQINERPRKKLGFSTPKIEFFAKIS